MKFCLSKTRLHPPVKSSYLLFWSILSRRKYDLVGNHLVQKDRAPEKNWRIRYALPGRPLCWSHAGDENLQISAASSRGKTKNYRKQQKLVDLSHKDIRERDFETLQAMPMAGVVIKSIVLSREAIHSRKNDIQTWKHVISLRFVPNVQPAARTLGSKHALQRFWVALDCISTAQRSAIQMLLICAVKRI